MLHNIKTTVPTTVKPLLHLVAQGLSPDQGVCHSLAVGQAKIAQPEKIGLLKGRLLSDFEWFECNEGCLK